MPVSAAQFLKGEAAQVLKGEAAETTEAEEEAGDPLRKQRSRLLRPSR
jgi:hypothetical protein